MEIDVVVGAERCTLGEAAATWVAETLRILAAGTGGPVAARDVADRLELALVGDRAPVVSLAHREAETVHRLIRHGPVTHTDADVDELITALERYLAQPRPPPE